MNVRKDILKLHEKLKSRVKVFKRLEAELIDLLSRMDQRKGFLDLGYVSLFAYCVEGLKLSESQASAFIAVARTILQVPEMKQKIEEGKLSVSKAKRLTGIIHAGNKEHWLKAAEELNYRELELAVAAKAPGEFRLEKKEALTSELMKLSLALPVEVVEKLERAKEIMKSSDTVSVLDELLSDYLKRNDPVEKAKRAQKKEAMSNKKANKKESAAKTTQKLPSKSSSRLSPRQTANPVFIQSLPPAVSKKEHSARNAGALLPLKEITRKRLPAKLVHQVYLRDKGACQFTLATGQKCGRKRYLEIHHRQPVSLGGLNELSNLEILCSAHHKMWHRQAHAYDVREGPARWVG